MARLPLRPVVFWVHLTVGAIAGAVIFVLSLTGMLLGYERQIGALHGRGGPKLAHCPPQERGHCRRVLGHHGAALGVIGTDGGSMSHSLNNHDLRVGVAGASQARAPAVGSHRR